MKYTQADQIYAKNLMKSCGSTYFTATKLFSKKNQQKIHAFYAFVRELDDIVDELPPKKQNPTFNAWVSAWNNAFSGKTAPTIPSHRLCLPLFKENNVKQHEINAFIDAMHADVPENTQNTQKNPYFPFLFENMGEIRNKTTKEDEKQEEKTLKTLSDYMYGSAGVIGLIIVKLLTNGTELSEKNRTSALKMGNAMQLTNFLRDVREDHQNRNRIYIPYRLAQKYGINAQNFTQKMPNEGKKLIQELTNLAKTWFAQSYSAISCLPRPLRWPIRASVQLYSQYLTQIEQNNYDIWDFQPKITKFQKIKLVLHAFLPNSYKNR